MNTMLTEEGLRYNFVFLFAYDGYWPAILGKNLYHSEKSRIYRTAFDGTKIEEIIFHYHWSYSLSSKIRVPLKNLWFKRMYYHNFNNDLPLCFVFMGGNNIRYDAGFCDYIRRMDSRNKIVILHNDIIAKHCRGYNYEEIRKKADLITTYDKKEAEKYGIEYFQETTYSKLIPEPNNISFKYDVYFLGAAKDRLNKIHETFIYLCGKGFKCKFIVTGVPKEKQISGIEYSKGVSYEDNLKNIIKSKCVLEIIQGDSSDITTRALEAIAYKRKFITDCPLDLTEFFNENQLCKYNDVQDINLNFINEEYLPEDFTPKIDMNPLKRLYFIQEKLDMNHEQQS